MNCYLKKIYIFNLLTRFYAVSLSRLFPVIDVKFRKLEKMFLFLVFSFSAVSTLSYFKYFTQQYITHTMNILALVCKSEQEEHKHYIYFE